MSDLLKSAQGLMGQAGGGADLGNIAQSVMGMMSKESGGIGGLVEQFQGAGLGDIAKSWVSTGQNLPISADQLTKVFGEQKLGAMANQAGVNLQQFLPLLVSALPMIVDKLTPDGEVNDKSNNMLEQGLGLLGGLFGK
ncbi:DUF937 domain-containing protein [bacterium]|nr:DUF937 domain-containing protein [bacterium]